MKKSTFIFTSLFLVNFIFAQKTDTWLEDHQPVPFQKLYLHTDRDFYFSKDTLWFAAYLVEGNSHVMVSESCNLYVDLVDKNGELIKNELFLIQNGLGRGWLSLSNSAELEGNYLLRAYTDYLKNFGNDAFFTKTIQISTVKNSFELANEEEFKLVTPSLPAQYDTIHQVKPKSQGEVSKVELVTQSSPAHYPAIDVSFLPEGGFLLAGESNCVAFKAVDEWGKGIPVSGTLLDEKDKPVLTFQSIYKGAGKFYFYPKAGKTYTAQIGETRIELPEVKQSGTKLKLVNQGNRQIQLVVQGKNTGRGHCTLVGMNRGRGLFYMEINRRKMNSILKIDTNNLRGGINQLVLLDNNLNPISERLVFKNNTKINHLLVRLNDDRLTTREMAQVNIKDTAKSEISFLSLAVVDENYLNATGVSQNIASYLLLDSELNGHIESPPDYFVSSDSIDSQTKLDLLMTTNGWSNYIWNDLDKDSVEIKFEPQLGYNFQGLVKRAIGKKALPEGDVTLMLFQSDSTTQIIDQPIDENGIFKFDNIFFTDSASVFVQARNKRNKNSVKFEMELPKFNFPIDKKQLQSLNVFTDIPVSVYRQRYLNKMRLKELYPDKETRLIDEINVTARKPEPKIKTGTPRKNNGAYQLTWEMTAGSFDIVEYLAYKVPGIFKIRTEENELYLKLTPSKMTGIASFFVDGYRYITYDEARSYNINDFKTIEIISPPMSYAYGARGIWGAINLTFKTGDEIALDRPLLGGMVEKIKGFTSFRQFYSPEYTPENVNSEAPDYRNTLYWNPGLILKNGQTEVSFFTSDNISRYAVLVEGISENGRICLGSAQFIVDKYQKEAKKTSPAKCRETDTSSQEVLTTAEIKKIKSEQPGAVASRKNRMSGKDFITGIVKNKFGEPVEFATLFNSTKQKSCITNDLGKFKLEAEIGDSVKIQHLNYKTLSYKILIKEVQFLLYKKDFMIEEVLVSPKFAFELFNKSCENTWKSFKDENISRAYCRCIKKENGQTALVADFDLDIVQKKRNKYKRGENVIPFKIQERMEVFFNAGNENYLFYLNLFYPFIQQIYWVDLPEQFIYNKQEDNNIIRLLLNSKSAYAHTSNIEVTIDKKDTVLLSFAMVRKGMQLPFKTYKSIAGKTRLVDDTIKVEETYHFIKYSYNAGFGYLSEYIQGAKFKESEQNPNNYEISEQLKTYQNGIANINKRPNRRRIFDNSVNIQKTNNRFSEEFWMINTFPKNINYSFEKLSKRQSEPEVNR